MIQFSIYLPRSRASAEPPTITLGLGNKLNDGYIPLIDIDEKIPVKNLGDILRAGFKILGKCDVIVSETKKGYHVIWLTKTDWKTLNRLWAKLKHIIDRKWINMQRKRGYAVIRVRGKYRERDIKPIVITHLYKRERGVEKWMNMYLKLLRR